MSNELTPKELRRECDPTSLMSCETTEGIPPLEGIIGQERAVKALKFGLEIKESGFNIYVAGPLGTGRTTAVKDFLEEIAKAKPVPSDWCYVNNFRNPHQPKAIRLPPGKARELQEGMANLVHEARRVLPKAFESEDYATKKDAAIRTIEDERKKLFAELNSRAQEKGFVLQSTPIGLLTIPVVDGRPLSDQDFMALSPQLRDEIQRRREELSAKLRSAMRRLRGLEGKVNEELKNVNREVALYAIGHLVADLTEKYEEFPQVVAYIKEVQDNILEKLADFIGRPKTPIPLPFPWMKELPFRKYEVNLIVDNSDLHGAPVVVELNPIYQNLFGRIEKEAQFGVLSTDFTMIRGGSLHKANGGYLVLPVEELLRNIFSWDGLKRALKSECVTIEEAGERLGFITTKGLMPAPIPLSTKVVLIGNPHLYQMLYMMDMDFKELFKVKADFDNTMDRTEENMRKYAAFICTFCRKEKLKHLDASAVAKVIEYGSRLAGSQVKLSTKFAKVADIIREANFYADQENSKHMTAAHIMKAIEEKAYRSNLIQEKIKEMIQREVLLIDTEGEVIGQVNGLAVISLGDFAFGRPSRVTASIGMGREGVIDIEREAKLGGRIHTKGVMILSGYLASKYARDKPLSLSARLVFEQSYSGVEGDSASSTELYAILSGLSEFSIKQGIAVTGSVNQKGEVQAIGGVNEKIEGFFEVCKAKGLTGQQGVIIPESNVQNLMLKEEVLDAVQDGKFHIYPVKTIDEGIEILSGVKAGVRLQDGTFEEETVNGRVDKRLSEMAEKLREFPQFVIERKRKE
ncbi:ATP-binding protein [Candidatus Bathyarchaeota archaeon]|nr:MAG: ATP-binding protein [Candidatus Bathyarchaeota archaeon]